MADLQQTLVAAVEAHRAGRLAEAEGLYKQVLAANPRQVDALRLLGLVAQAVGKNDIAAQLIGQALKVDPRSADAWSDLAGVYAQTGRTAQAMEAYRKAIDFRPSFAAARNNLGDLLSRMGRTDEAMACWRETIKVDPNLAEPHYNLGRALFAEGNVEEAIESFRRAIATQPRYAPAHNNLGAVLWAAGKHKEASECFCRALDVNPNYAEAWNNLGSAWESGGKRDDAIECFTKAIRIKPGYAEAHRNLAEALEKKGARHAALKEWEEALRLRPDWEELHYHMAAVKASDAPQPTAPPPGYISRLFDEYADKFDEHLLKTLEYRVPQLLVEAVKRVGQERFDVVVDVGCGTGLCGEQFRPMAGRLIGVDVAPRMIEKSRERGVYDELMVGGLEEALRGRSDVDLIIAGDVLGYVGELSAVFKVVGESLRPGGLLVFSVEKPSAEEGEGLVLRKTRRFAHSRSYMEKLAREVGLDVMEMSDAVIRMDDLRPIDGMIGVMRKA